MRSTKYNSFVHMNNSKIRSFSWLIVVWLILAACTSNEKFKEEDPQKIRRDIPPTEVQVVKAVRKPFEYLIHTSGRVKPMDEVMVKFRRAGIIKEIKVRNGQRVQKGEVLAHLEYDRQQLQVERARVQLEEKKLAFEDQMMSFRGTDSVRQKRIEANIRISSGLAAAEVAYKEAMLDYEHTFVRATLGGVATGMEVKPGNPVEEGQLFCYVHNPGKMAVQCEVIEADALQLKPGAKAEVNMAGGELYTGRIAELNPRVDEKTGMVNVTILIEQPNASLMPGMHVQVMLRLPYEQHIIVPKEAVVIRSGRAVVFTAEDGLAKWNYVTTGRENGKEIEILDGLADDKAVIVTNNLQLAHDAPVSEVKNF
ncbi:MAG: efflux RND transporter periplasmic adaptor subunit [Cyclobacteriaceae bacterium]